MREIHAPCWYRLLDELPLVVTFPSVTYDLLIQPVTGAPVWRLNAVARGWRGEWMLCHAGSDRSLLERAIYREGFEVLRPTVGSLILDQLCASGQAQADRGRRGHGDKPFNR
jgi:hypothetical protein